MKDKLMPIGLLGIVEGPKYQHELDENDVKFFYYWLGRLCSCGWLVHMHHGESSQGPK